MKTKNAILLICLFILGSQVISSQSKAGDLPVIDISMNYPQKEIRLIDIADIEYIPLETTDDILLGRMASLTAVTDKYMLIQEPEQGDIFVFNRNGRLYSHFNHKGGSGQEYGWIIKGGTIFDEKKEEIYVCSQYIQVYSLKGEHKRTLKRNTLGENMKIVNFDDETLLVFEDVVLDPGFEKNTKERPYYLISKKDGNVVSVLDIHFSKRYSNRMFKILDNNESMTNILFYPHSMYYGQDLVIADISSDTLYLLNQNKKLTPLLTRNPSIHADIEPKTILTPQLTSDKFMILGLILLDFKSKGSQIPMLMYDFKTGEISKVTFFDEAGRRGTWGPGTSPAIEKNSTAELIQAQSIIDIYKKKRLKGDIEKLAKMLDEDDNPVVRIIKFK